MHPIFLPAPDETGTACHDVRDILRHSVSVSAFSEAV
ncbi:hypothetical protein Xinn_03630 [Xenorhabdus innexi]|uniref:Uncharacterized protein n=1 Tax=Xenorhabdus innexi TaxID=290109 RepID=A0A2G0N5P5_9GAMM|nr:hypothetical protein Xinn_03630 [Xenorhabdus innexi]